MNSPRGSPAGGFVSRVAGRWRSEAEILYRRGASEQAAVLESCAAELEQDGRLFSLEALDLEQAAVESGYSYSALQKMVSAGIIPNVGKKGAPRVRRGDLPMKATTPTKTAEGERDLAELVLGTG